MTTRAAILLLAALPVAGCEQGLSGLAPSPAVSTRPLGEVDYGTAFAEAKDVFSQYYTIRTADAATGEITGEPVATSVEPDRLLGSSPARQRATLRLRREGPAVWADVRVAVERLQSTDYRSFEGLHGPRDVPRQTPAQGEAPLTQEQQEIWRPAGNNLQTERSMLSDLARRLKAAEANPPLNDGGAG